MDEKSLASLEASFKQIPDPRVQGRCDHKLIEIIIIAICGMISGADSWTEIEAFGHEKEGWLRTFLELAEGIPSHDTFGRVFSLLDAEAFQRSFSRWVEQVFRVTQGQVIAIDGKTSRGSHDQGIGKSAIHLVNAWASESGISLGQRQVDSKSNEITAIPELLRLLYLRGCIVTIDAMGCQTEIARTIVEQQADYVLPVKQNQGKLYQDLVDWFAYAYQVQFQGMSHDFAHSLNKTSGRIECRRCWAIADPLAFDFIRHYEGWAGLQTIVMLQRERRWADQHQAETSYYISSLPPDAALLLNSIRQHWSVENNLHWVLDVIFREDDSRIRSGDSPQNMAVLRHIALNILQQDKTKGSLKQKRFRAALNDHFRFQLLTQF